MQSEVSKDLPPLENIEQRRIEVQYIRNDGSIEARPVRLYIPGDAQQPMPLFMCRITKWLKMLRS